MRIYLILFGLLSLAAFNVDNPILGRWETKPSEKGNVTGVVFKANYEFEGYVNKKPFVSGTYSVDGDKLSFVDNGCEGKKAIYKMIFFSNSDSVRFKAIQDECVERKNGMEKTILGKVNTLVGQWESKPSEFGDVTGVTFKTNNEFESHRNNAPYISGIYFVKGKVVEITDNGCGVEPGTYELVFFSNSDSLRFKAIDDICGQRKYAIESTILGRVK